MGDIEETLALATDLVKEISECLSKGLTEEAVTAINDNKYNECLKNNCWDLIPVVCGYLQEDTLSNKPNLYECCEKLLGTIAVKSNAEEALLEFIEQAELAKYDIKFISIVQALQKILLKLTNKRGRSLEWVFNTIQAHVSELPLPGEYNLEDSTIIDADEAVSRITSFYQQLLPFYKPFIEEVSLPNHISVELKHRRDVITSFMLQLLGKPLACLDLERGIKSKSRARVCAEEIMQYLSVLVGDCYRFLKYLERPALSNDLSDEPITDVFLCEERAPLMAFGVFYYLILSENIEIGLKPCNYNPIYIFHGILELATLLLKQPEQYIMRKGILLSHASVCGLPIEQFSYELLDASVHCNFCLTLVNIMVYSDIKPYRELCLKIFKTYLFKFDNKGRYLLINNLMDSVTHVNTRGYLITQYKDFLREILSKDENNVCQHFCEQRLFDIVNKFCHLPEGRESDLMENGDQIISSLNLLIYLALRDKLNVTGIWKHFPYLEKTFFKPLKDGIDISRAHYQLKMRELKGERKNQEFIPTVSVHGMKLPAISYEDQESIIHCALNSFSALDMLLARIRELIDDGPEVDV